MEAGSISCIKLMIFLRRPEPATAGYESIANQLPPDQRKERAVMCRAVSGIAGGNSEMLVMMTGY